MAENWLEQVAQAVVRLPKLGGQGVLVQGGFMLTAAHCVEWEETGDRYLQPVETRTGKAFHLSPVAVDLVSDLAVLGAPDIPNEGPAFEQWSDAVGGVPLSIDFAAWCERFGRAADRLGHAVQCLTHEGVWVRGAIVRTGLPGPVRGPAHLVSFISQIPSGTSGGPIVDQVGLVGILSNAPTTANADGSCEGMQPLLRNALPRWVLDSIPKGQMPSGWPGPLQ